MPATTATTTTTVVAQAAMCGAGLRVGGQGLAGEHAQQDTAGGRRGGLGGA